METKSNKIKVISIPLAFLLVAGPVLFNAESASAAPKVAKPSISIQKNSAGKTAIIVNAGTKYAGKAIKIARIVQVSLQDQINPITTVKVGTNGKAVALTYLRIKKGSVLSATIGTRLIVKSSVTTIRTVAVLPKSSPVVQTATTPIAFNSVTANGTSNSVSTTALTLTFSADVAGLSAADLTVFGAIKGALTKTGVGVYTLGVSNIVVANGANLTVAVTKAGFVFTPASLTVPVNVGITPITFNSVTANGTNGTVSTTALTLTFSADVAGLSAADLTLTGATKGVLTKTGTGVYTLGITGITVPNGSNITVAVAKSGFIFTPSSQNVVANVLSTSISFTSLSANGSSNSVTTSALSLTFSADVAGLSATDITVTGATKGSLTRIAAGVYTLGIGGITVSNGSNITVAVAKTGFTFSPASRTVAANVATTSITFSSLSGNGSSNSVNTTTLFMTFSADIAGFSVSDITLTGATKGLLNRTGTGAYTLGISNITVPNGSNITVAVAKSGVTFTPSSRSVAANVVTTSITFSSLSANGSSNAVTTTTLALTFSADIDGLTASDLSVNGATKGALSRSSTGLYLLTISNITVPNGSNITVAVIKSGFTFTPDSRTVAANVAITAFTFSSLTANGTSNSVTTTSLTLTFSAEVPGLSGADLVVSGATEGVLTQTGAANVYTLTVTGITVNGAIVTVSIIKAGITFTPDSKTVAVNFATP